MTNDHGNLVLLGLTRHPTTGSGQAAGLSLSGSLCQAR